MFCAESEFMAFFISVIKRRNPSWCCCIKKLQESVFGVFFPTVFIKDTLIEQCRGRKANLYTLLSASTQTRTTKASNSF